MSAFHSRREFLRKLQLSTAALPFVTGLPSFAASGKAGAGSSQSAAAKAAAKKQRLVILFSPNGVVQPNFWPDEEGAKFKLKPILKPLAKFQDKVLTLHGVNDKIRGDGDSHMRGIGCLLTGIELFPGNIQGGSHTPAGWSSGHSIDQEIKNFLQKNPATRTRFGSLEFGVGVPDRADTWTRMVYAGPNKPIAPIDDPYQMFHKLYGRMKDQATLRSVLDELQEDLKKVRAVVGQEDRRMLDEHAAFVREMEQELKAAKDVGHAVPELTPGVKDENDNVPQLSKMQIDLLVDSLANDFTRIATLQFDRSVGGTKMHWLGIDEGHHSLSHEPDKNTDAQAKLTKINTWYCEQLAYLAKRLAATPEPGGDGTMLDHTTILWTNELGKGNSHTLNDIPFVLVGGGLDGFHMGRSLKLKGVNHNRLLLSLAHGFGHTIERFGNPDFCTSGPLSLG